MNADDVIKEVRLGNGQRSTIGIIRRRDYDKRLSRFVRFMEIAKETFPDLTSDDFEIRFYGGDRCRFMAGIEFKLPDLDAVPDGWTAIAKLEGTLA